VLEDDLGRAVRRSGVKARLQRIGSAFTLFFSPEEVVDMASARKAVALEPKNAPLHDKLGVALYASGRVDEAITSFRTAIELDPRYTADAYSNLGAVGHINAEAGFGPLPVAKSWVEAARARHAAENRPRHAEFREWAFAV